MATMKKHQFKININAPCEKVWATLWGSDTYSQWTAPFAAGSVAVTDWQKGSKALFLDGRGHGMVSRIVENIPNEYMSIEHLGDVRDGVEDTRSGRVNEWAGAHEDYTLKNNNGITELTIDMDLMEEFAEMFNRTWPLALAKVKEIAEKR